MLTPIIPSFLLSEAPSVFSPLQASPSVSQPFSRESAGVRPTAPPFSARHAHHFLSSLPPVRCVHLLWPVRSPSNAPPVPFYLCGGGGGVSWSGAPVFFFLNLECFCSLVRLSCFKATSFSLMTSSKYCMSSPAAEGEAITF